MLAAGLEGKEPVAVSWEELAELVYGEFSPASAASCARLAPSSGLFRVGENGPLALSPTEIENTRRKADEKRMETERRAAFVQAFRNARKTGLSGAQPPLRSLPESARLIGELESFALGLPERVKAGCALAAEAGIAETPEAVHQALVDTGIWPPFFNPWPARAGATLHAPSLEFPEEEAAPAALVRMDLTRLDSLAIDNAWSRDPDDAIALDEDRIWVHVADPSAWILPDSAVDRDALLRGATLYLPERVIPMLPAASLDRLGLGLAGTSPSLSFGMKLDADGSLVDTVITAATVKVRCVDYEEADRLLAGGDAQLSRLEQLAALRTARRLANGAVDIDLPEVAMKVKDDAPAFLPVPETRSSVIVREMMLLAGEAAARWAYERRIPFVYSSQEAPQLPSGLSSHDGGQEKSLAVHFARRKGMRASITGTECLAHRGLGLSFYTQVTSPLRRYQDLLAHYQLRAALVSMASSGRDRPDASSLLSPDEISRRSILASRGAMCTRQAERDSRMHWIAVHMAANTGWEGDAVVLEYRGRDAWILIPAMGFETSIRCREELQPDMKIRVRAVRASIPYHDISFDIVHSGEE
jgi:exoribonuclease-2